MAAVLAGVGALGAANTYSYSDPKDFKITNTNSVSLTVTNTNTNNASASLIEKG